MKTIQQLALILLATVFTLSARNVCAEQMFYRITSTQQTGIFSFDAAGNLEWTNSTIPTMCAVKRTARLDLPWEPHLDPVVVTANTARVLLPLSASVPVAKQKFLFELNHVGGWGFGHGGFYVDNSGFVYTYYQDRYFTDPTNGVVTVPYLDGKTSSNRMYLATVMTAELTNMWNLLPQAATGSVSNPRPVANDLGVNEYRGFMLNPSSNEYAVILLGMDGDFEATNSAPEASILVNWLQSIAGSIPEGWFTQ